MNEIIDLKEGEMIIGRQIERNNQRQRPWVVDDTE